MSGTTRIVQHLIKRLNASVSRSPVLRVRVGKTGRLVDCSRFEVVDSGLPSRILNAVINNSTTVNLDLAPQIAWERDYRQRNRFQKHLFDYDEIEKQKKREAEERRLLYATLIKSVKRHGDLAKRETGIHAMWLGYPLLFVAADVEDESQKILSPVFLWPISIEPDLRHEWRIRIRRSTDGAAPRFNRVMAAWIRRYLMVELAAPTEDQLIELNRGSLQDLLDQFADQFQRHPTVKLGDAPAPVPKIGELNQRMSPSFFNSAVLGYLTWQHEAILADLEKIGKNLNQCEGLVRAFALGEEVPPPPRPEPPAEKDRFVVYDADHSQERVIWQSRQKPGLVMHGPPGTGKSQTIVNIVADALAHGRTVLMVCQKRAATQVVLERLRAVGLADLCVEAHDVEGDRVAIFKTIRNQVEELRRDQSPFPTDRRTRLANQITEIEGELDRYVTASHERNPRVGISYKDTKVKEWQAYRDFPAVRELQDFDTVFQRIGADELDRIANRVMTVAELFGRVDPFRNPWRYRHENIAPSRALTNDVQRIKEKILEADRKHMAYVGDRGTGITLPRNLEQFSSEAPGVLQKVKAIHASHGNTKRMMLRAWLSLVRSTNHETITSKRAECEEAERLAGVIREVDTNPEFTGMLRRFSDSELRLLHRESHVVLRCRLKWWRFLTSRYISAWGSVRRFIPRKGGWKFWGFASAVARHLDGYLARQDLRELAKRIVPGVIPKRQDDTTIVRFALLAAQAFRDAVWMCSSERSGSWVRSLAEVVCSAESTQDVEPAIRSVETALSRVPLVEEVLYAFAGLTKYFATDGLEEPAQKVLSGESVAPWLEYLETQLGNLQALIALEKDREKREGLLKTILDQLEDYEKEQMADQNLPTTVAEIAPEHFSRRWNALLSYTAARVWQRIYEKEHPELSEVTRSVYSQKVKQLAQLLSQKRKMEADAIKARLRSVQAESLSAEWKRIFQLRRSKYGSAKRLREAVDLGLESDLLTLRPCWLVNPSVAAQIFPLRQGLFDLVIFDEASQCPIEQALPAIYRGKALVVAGDEKQLPPTSFFSSRVDEDLDEEEENLEASEEPVKVRERRRARLGVEHMLQAENLLEAAVGTLDEHWLCVHYRSEHPDLIRYSNQAFYEGRLEVPPARLEQTRPPIIFHHVDGTYSARKNEKEAHKLVEILREFWLGSSRPPTIGVVTFNQPQRDLIEDFILDKCQRDPAFAIRYQEEVAQKIDNQDVGFFVKNIENVQGDEREVMMFSTTFGRDSDGRFFRRFGPVGAFGGERRLNVAVTRAKRQVVVLCSMPIDEISIALRTDTGVGGSLTPAGYLQLYLAYAEAISAGDAKKVAAVLGRFTRQSSPVRSVGEPESPFEVEVLEVIEKLGYIAEPQVGEGGFRIDIGVVHPEPELGYILGIECDGAPFHSDRSARIRDAWRESILRGRGWKLHRIWSTDWWHRRQREIERLSDALEKAASS